MRNQILSTIIPLVSASTVIRSASSQRECSSGVIDPPEIYGASILSIKATQATLRSTSTTFCNITIDYTHPGQDDHIVVWLGLPDKWNGRFQGVGGGGYATGEPSRMEPAISKGYATVGTNGGHLISAAPASWGLASPGNVNLYNLQNFASVALHDMTVMGKKITESYYGRAITKSYWYGCSTGGRQGLMMAQRYPDAYDGILAEAPAINWAQFVPAEFWPQLAMKLVGYIPTQCELTAITEAAIEACDELDGLKDGIVSLWGQCNFDAVSAVGKSYNCTGGISGIVSNKAAKLAQKIWEGPRDAHGKFQWYGLSPGTPLGRLSNTTLTPSGTLSAGPPFGTASAWISIFVKANETFDPYSLTQETWDEAWQNSGNRYDSIIGTKDADLSLFKRNGGKIITWHGVADPLIFINGSVNYYERIGAIDAHVTDFYRFFSAPGVGHCSGGNGAAPSRALDQLVDWVESGNAPATLQANSTVQGKRWDRNLCLFPAMSIYKGGDPSSADSYTCK